jgi:hypothetical protein
MRKAIMVLILLAEIKYLNAQNQRQYHKDSLPEVIKKDIIRQYSSYIVNSCDIEFEKGIITKYKIELQKKKRALDLIYDSDGKFLEKRKSKIFTFNCTEKTEPKDDGHNHQHSPFPKL